MKENIVKKSIFFIFMIMSMLTFISCDDNDDTNGDDFKRVYFSLEKVNDSSFMLKVAGAEWDKTADEIKDAVGAFLYSADLRGHTNVQGNPVSRNLTTPQDRLNPSLFQIVKTSNTVITYTIEPKSINASADTDAIISGTLTFSNDFPGEWLRSFGKSNTTGGTAYYSEDGTYDTYNLDPAKSSITWQ